MCVSLTSQALENYHQHSHIDVEEFLDAQSEEGHDSSKDEAAGPNAHQESDGLPFG